MFSPNRVASTADLQVGKRDEAGVFYRLLKTHSEIGWNKFARPTFLSHEQPESPLLTACDNGTTQLRYTCKNSKAFLVWWPARRWSSA